MHWIQWLEAFILRMEAFISFCSVYSSTWHTADHLIEGFQQDMFFFRSYFIDVQKIVSTSVFIKMKNQILFIMKLFKFIAIQSSSFSLSLRCYVYIFYLCTSREENGFSYHRTTFCSFYYIIINWKERWSQDVFFWRISYVMYIFK